MATTPDEMYWRGVGLAEQGRYKEAREFFSKAIKSFEAANNLEYAALARNNMGYVLEHLGSKPEDCMSWYNEAFELFNRISDRQGAADSLQNVGRLYLAARDFEKGIETYREVINRFDSLADSLSSAICRSILAAAILNKTFSRGPTDIKAAVRVAKEAKPLLDEAVPILVNAKHSYAENAIDSLRKCEKILSADLP